MNINNRSLGKQSCYPGRGVLWLFVFPILSFITSYMSTVQLSPLYAGWKESTHTFYAADGTTATATTTTRPRIGILASYIESNMWSPRERDIKLQALFDQITNRQCYAHLWNYDFILNQTRELSGSNSNSSKWWLEYGAWDRIPHLQAALPKYDWVLYGDLDYIIKDYSRPLDSFIKEFEMYGLNNTQVLIPVDDNEADIPIAFSSFAIMIKNGPFGKKLLENWRTFAAGLCPNGNFESKTKSYEWYHCDQPGLWYALMQTHKEFYPNDRHLAQCNEDTGYIQDNYWLGFNTYFTKVGYKVGNYGEHLSRVPKDQAIIWSKSSNQSMSGLGVNRNWSFKDKYREHAFAFHWNKPSSQWDPDMQRTLSVCKEIHGCFARLNNETLKIESGCSSSSMPKNRNLSEKDSDQDKTHGSIGTPYKKDEISYAMCVPPRNLIHAYAQGMMQSFEAEVTFCHVDELSSKDKQFLSHVPNSRIVDLKDYIPKGNDLKFYQSYPCKILCTLASNKRLVIVMDNDQLPLMSPISMVNENVEQFQKTGWYLGHDTQNKQHTIPALIKSQNFSDWVSEAYGSKTYFNFITRVKSSAMGRINSGFAESSLFIIDKELKAGTIRVLQDIHNDIDVAKMIYKAQYHDGDKDVFWMACFLTEEDCSLNPWSMGTLGRAVEGKYCEPIGYGVTHFHPYESQLQHPRLISIQGWIVRLGVDSKDFDKYYHHAPPPRNRELESDELSRNTTWTFSEPLLFEEQVERIEKREYKSKLSSLQKVMDPEYEHRGIKLFYDVSKRRNTFANQGREILEPT